MAVAVIPSITLVAAGAFLTLIQSGDRPDR